MPAKSSNGGKLLNLKETSNGRNHMSALWFFFLACTLFFFIIELKLAWFCGLLYVEKIK